MQFPFDRRRAHGGRGRHFYVDQQKTLADLALHAIYAMQPGPAAARLFGGFIARAPVRVGVGRQDEDGELGV